MVFDAPGHSNAHVWSSVKPRRPQSEAQTCTFEGRGLQNPPKFQEERKERNIGRSGGRSGGGSSSHNSVKNVFFHVCKLS